MNRHYTPKSLFLLLLALIVGVISQTAYATMTPQRNPAFKITKTLIDLNNESAQRPIKLDLWYQENNQAQQTSPAKNIAILSHGAMGSALDYSWIAYPLAANGWTVIGMNHFGESWRYGQNNIDPSAVTRFWQRTEDISFVVNSLDTVLPNSTHEQKYNIVVIGHSSGGQTAAALAGVTMSFQQMHQYCHSQQSTGDLGCTYAKSNNGETKLPKNISMKPGLDTRISAIVMLDPALGPAATIDSLNNVTTPALIVGSKNNDFLPFEHHAKYYATHLPNAALITLNNNEGHFVYLSECDHPHKARGVSLCKDREGVNRKQVHRKILGQLFNFLNKHQAYNSKS